MNDILDADQPNEFFAPVASDLFDSLIGQYNAARAKIEEIAALASGAAFSNAIHYFIEGNAGDDRFHRAVYVDRLFETKGAVAALNAAYWSKALGLTDVIECMPQARRDEWNKSIKEHTTPDFTEEAVRPTLVGLMNMRHTFLAEKVDGIFRGLSGEHVTNAPEAFGKRMIISYLRTSYDTMNHSKAGLIHDLRCIIARIMGRDEPRWTATSQLLNQCSVLSGQWVSADGGAIRVRTYKKGTGHMEIHPDMAWRLNMILAHLYPAAIPAEFRQKPKRPRKDFPTLLRPLPFAVIEMLEGCLQSRSRRDGNMVSFYYDAPKSGPVFEEACRVLAMIGGTPDKRAGYFDFDYPPGQVLKEIIVTGCIPDRIAFQYYATSERLAKDAVEMADIRPTDDILEPSAGQGAIATHLPPDRLQCVELSALHCAVLDARGFKVAQADFLAWTEEAVEKRRVFQKIIMNPPFADGRAKLHVEHAAKLLAPGGRLVAILPASMNGSQFLRGFECKWSRIYRDEFKGTDVSVVILSIDAPAVTASARHTQDQFALA